MPKWWVELVVYYQIQNFLSYLQKKAKSFSKFPILLTFIYLVALNLLVNNQLNSSLRHIIVTNVQLQTQSFNILFSFCSKSPISKQSSRVLTPVQEGPPIPISWLKVSCKTWLWGNNTKLRPSNKCWLPKSKDWNIWDNKISNKIKWQPNMNDYDD